MTLLLAAFLFLFLNTDPARADAGDQYLLPKAGIMTLDLGDVQPLYSFGLMYGYGLQERLSLELEFNAGVAGGAWQEDGERGHYRVMTVGAYGVYRHPFTRALYAKLKLGALHERVTRKGGSAGGRAVDSGFAGGFGAGYVFGARFIGELELTVIDRNIVFLSTGLHYRF